MSGRHGGRGGGVLDASIDMREVGDAEHPAAVIALATINGSGQRRCLRCQGDRLHRHGKGRTGLQRWRCRHCQHTFSSTSGTMLAGLHAPAKLGIVVSDMLSAEPSSCRRLARALQLSKMTIWAWRQKVSRAFVANELSSGKDGDNARLHRAAQPTVTVLRESRKASREWVDHQRDPARCPTPDRRRWVDYRMHDLPLPRPMAPFLVTVSFDASGLGRHERGRMPQEADALAATTRGIDMPLKCDQDGGAQARSADPHAACQPAGVSADTSARTAGQLACPLDRSEFVDHFQTFVSVFSGPATKHLGGYLAWFDARLRASDDRRTRQVWRATLKVLTTRSPTRFWDMLNIGGPTQRQRRAAA